MRRKTYALVIVLLVVALAHALRSTGSESATNGASQGSQRPQRVALSERFQPQSARGRQASLTMLLGRSAESTSHAVQSEEEDLDVGITEIAPTARNDLALSAGAREDEIFQGYLALENELETGSDARADGHDVQAVPSGAHAAQLLEGYGAMNSPRTPEPPPVDPASHPPTQ